MAETTQYGSIEIIFGPMFSGKSTELVRMVKRYSIAQKKCLIINYYKDERYSSESVISTHDRTMMQALKCKKIEDALPVYKDYDVIAIDEGQFFPDIVEKAEFFANKGKIVIVAALDATFQRKPFDVINLLPIAEKVTKLSAVCVVCSADAPFTQRLVENSEVELIGGTELYRPVCRKCYMQSSSKKQTERSRIGVRSSEKPKKKEEKELKNTSTHEVSIEVAKQELVIS